MSQSPRLVVLSGPQQGRVYVLDALKTFIIGRGNDSQTRIQDPLLSRVHCRIDWIQGEPWLVDANSTSGTFLGTKKIDRQLLQAGDVFSIGNSTIRFECDKPTDVKAAAPTPLNSNPLLQPAQPVVRAAEHPLQALVGQQLGSFRLDRILAEGSSGVVFKGTDLDKGIPAAIKVLEPDVDHHDEQKERFVRAMKTMINIRHPHIVSLLGAGKQGRYCWAAMEFIEGDSLAKVIELIGIGNILPWRESFRVAVQIGRALEEAAKHKWIHRNVTPHNILRRNLDACHLLGDLMLAKALEGTHAKQVTRAGKIVGDLAYLPPERTISGSVIDERSDLYGLGATLYALNSGRPPATGRSMADIVQSIHRETPSKLSVFQKDIDPEFEEVVLRLLAKAPEARYQSAWILMKDLERIGARLRLTADAANWVD